MKRSIKPRKVGMMPWLIGLGLMGGLLFLLFSFGQAHWLRKLPFAAAEGDEWTIYNALFDRSTTRSDTSTSVIYRFGGSSEVAACIEDQRGGAWRTRWFEADGYGDSVEVRNLSDRAGILVRFKKTALYRDQRRIMLTPATAEHERSPLLVSLAAEMGLVTTSTSRVRVLSCGKELGEYSRTEWVDAEMLERKGLHGVTLLKQGFDPSRPDQQFVAIDADSSERVQLRGVVERALSEVQRGNTDMLAGLVDEKAAVAWLLMAWIDGRDLRAEPVTFIYHWSTGHFSPIYQPPSRTGPSADGAPLAYNLLTPLLRRPAFKALFQKRQAELAAKLPELEQRWRSNMGMDTSTRTIFSATHLADVNAVTHLDRPLLFGPGHATFVNGMYLPPVATVSNEDTAMLALISKRYKLVVQGDSVIFPRGKYMINEDLEFPAGRSVLMLQGARIFLAAGKSIVCKGDLYVRGTLRNPVFIRPQDDDAPFGSVALLGSGSQQCAISGLYVSGGSGAKLFGTNCEGMVTLQGAARTKVMSSVFQENTAGASLIVDGGDLEMNDVRCEGGAKEFVRVDHVQGVLRDLTLVGARANTTTGLHVGTGTVAVIRGVFMGLRGNGILVDGAAQVLVRKARISQNAVAVRSEGRAVVHVEGNAIDGNDLVFATDAGGSGSRIILYPNTLTGNKLEREVGSSIVEESALEAGTVGQFGIQLDEPEPEVKKPKRGRSSRSTPSGD